MLYEGGGYRGRLVGSPDTSACGVSFGGGGVYGGAGVNCGTCDCGRRGDVESVILILRDDPALRTTGPRRRFR